MINLYAIGGLSVALALASFGLYKQVQANGELSVRIEEKDAQIKSGAELIEKERTLSKEANQRAIESQLRADQNEKDLDLLRACIADKSCVPRVRIKTACPAVPSTTTSPSGSNAAAAGFAEIDGQDYYRLIEAQKNAIWMIQGLQAEVKARSANDFCQPK